MFLLRWYREYLEIKESQECQSCSMLREQLMMERQNNQRLMDRILTPQPIIKEAEPLPPPISVPKVVPWHVKRQMLEQEDRVKAQKLRNAGKPDTAVTEEEAKKFEEELNNASAAREAQTKNS